MMRKGVGLRAWLHIYGERADITLGLVYEISMIRVDAIMLF